MSVGPTARRVAQNVRAVRVERRLLLDDVSDRLRELGHPILKTGLSKLERGERRVDVDDLVALAIALGVTPNRLLLTESADDEDVELTESFQTTRRAAWVWAAAEDEPDLDAPDPSRVFGEADRHDLLTANRPQNPPLRLTIAEWVARSAALERERMKP